MPYGIGARNEEEDGGGQEIIPAPSRRELAQMEEDRNMEIAERMRSYSSERSSLRDSASQVREVIYDLPIPQDVINGPVEETLNYFIEKCSRIPAYSSREKERTMRAIADIEDAMGVDQYTNIIKTKLGRRIIDLQLSTSLVDVPQVGESGISSITVQSTKQDMRITNNTPPQPPDSIFAGLFRKGR